MAVYSIAFIYFFVVLLNCDAAVIYSRDEARVKIKQNYNQRWRRQDQDQCVFDNRILLCSPESMPTCNSLSRPAGTTNRFSLLLPEHEDITLRNEKNYDVHAFRLCGGTEGKDVTLEKAIENGENCPLPRQFKLPSTFLPIIEFENCGEYFDPQKGHDLEIYAFTSTPECTGPIKYRFVIINTTGKPP